MQLIVETGKVKMKNKLFKLVLGSLILVGIAMVFYNREQVEVSLLQHWVEQSGWFAPLIFMLIYALATVLFFPAMILTITGGLLFGPVWGTLINLTGASIGAVLAFLVSRYLAGQWVETKVGGRLQRLKLGVEAEGWRFVALLRLVPLIPFNVLNYALGLTRIPLLSYFLASFIFMLPGAIAYTYLGYAGGQAITGGDDMVTKSLLALSLLALVAFLPGLISRIKRKPMLAVGSLSTEMQQNQMVLLDVRSEKEFIGEQGHIHNAINIPLENLASRLDELNEYLEQPLAIICRTDRRSAKAAQLLGKNGFADVHVVEGGMTAWNQANFPLEL